MAKCEDFTFRQCSLAEFDEILAIQEEAFQESFTSTVLRRNTPEMLRRCLEEPHITIGAWAGDILAGFAILYIPKDDESDNLAKYLNSVDATGLTSVNFKLCIVRKAFRGRSLQCRLGAYVEDYAKKYGADIICCTIHPDNIFSSTNALQRGYTYDSTISKYDSTRNLYYKMLKA